MRKRKREDAKSETTTFKRLTRQSIAKQENIAKDIVNIDICSDEDTIIVGEEIKENDQEITFEPVSLSQELSQNSSEDLLWTWKYKPTCGDKIIGHSSLVSSLKASILNWSKNFKLGLETGEDVNSTILIQGPPGIGKTSLVYALASELQFKVFEVNCSSIKNVTYLTRKLREATQCHHVDRSSLPQSSQELSSKNEMNFLTKAKNTLFNYFNSNIRLKSANSESSSKSDVIKSSKFSLEKEEGEQLPALSLSSNSLILFDDVDFLIGKEIDNFWRAVNSLISTSKKPVILTTTQFTEQVEKLLNNVEVYRMIPPKGEEIALHLNEIYSKEVEKQACFDLNLLEQFDGDIRRCVNQLQFDDNFCSQSQEEAQKFYSDSNLFNSFAYLSSLIIDLITKESYILSPDDLRKRFLKGQPLPFQDDTNSRQLSIEIVSSIRHLQKICQQTPHSELNTTKYDSKQSANEDFFKKLNLIASKLSSNLPLSVISSDYLPYLSEICKYEKSIVESPPALGRTRRSTRYCSYLKSVQLCDDDNFDLSQTIKSFEMKDYESSN